MSAFYVSLSSIEDVRQFVNAATCCPCEVDVLSGRYVVDAKSIMGVFSLGTSQPVTLEIDSTAAQSREADEFVKSVQEFVVE